MGEKGERRENPGEAEIKPTMERTSEEQPTTSERAPRREGRLGERKDHNANGAGKTVFAMLEWSQESIRFPTRDSCLASGRGDAVGFWEGAASRGDRTDDGHEAGRPRGAPQ